MQPPAFPAFCKRPPLSFNKLSPTPIKNTSNHHSDPFHHIYQTRPTSLIDNNALTFKTLQNNSSLFTISIWIQILQNFSNNSKTLSPMLNNRTRGKVVGSTGAKIQKGFDIQRTQKKPSPFDVDSHLIKPTKWKVSKKRTKVSISTDQFVPLDHKDVKIQWT